MFHFVEFGELRQVHMLIHHTIETYFAFQWASALNSEKADSDIAHLLEMVVILEMPLQIETDGASTYISIRIQLLTHYGLGCQG